MRQFLLVSTIALTLAGCQKAVDERSNAAVAKDTTKSTAIVAKAVSETSRRRPPIALDKLIIFTDPSLCSLNEAGGYLMDGLHKYGDDRPIILGTIVAPARYRDAFGTPSLKPSPVEYEGQEPEMEAKLPVSATWHGLAIVEIYSRKTNFSDAWSYTFTFDEPYEKVRSTLNRMGFKFAPDGKQPSGNSETAPYVELSRYEGQTDLSCSF